MTASQRINASHRENINALPPKAKSDPPKNPMAHHAHAAAKAAAAGDHSAVMHHAEKMLSVLTGGTCGGAAPAGSRPQAARRQTRHKP